MRIPVLMSQALCMPAACQHSGAILIASETELDSLSCDIGGPSKIFMRGAVHLCIFLITCCLSRIHLSAGS